MQYSPAKASDFNLDLSNYDRPLPFKIYRNRESIDLDDNFPICINDLDGIDYSNFEIISYLLWYTYGFTSYNWLTKPTLNGQNTSLSF